MLYALRMFVEIFLLRISCEKEEWEWEEIEFTVFILLKKNETLKTIVENK